MHAIKLKDKVQFKGKFGNLAGEVTKLEGRVTTVKFRVDNESYSFKRNTKELTKIDSFWRVE